MLRSRNNNTNTIVLLIISGLLFMINPLLSIVCALLFASQSRKDDFSWFYVLIILLSFYLGLINSTKVPESDLERYKYLFLAVKEYNLWDYLMITAKEPVFSLFNYVTYYITGGSYFWYITLFTAIFYIIFLGSVFRFFKALNADNLSILFAIVLGSFFYQQFQASAHLMRQFMAASILIYYMVSKMMYGKNKWWLLIIAALTHSSTIIFIPFMFLRVLKKPLLGRSGIFTMILLVAAALGASILLPYLASALSGVPFLGYIFLRLDGGQFGGEDSGYISLFGIVFSVVFTIIAAWGVITKRRTLPAGAVLFFNIFLLLNIFLLITMNNPLISLRYFYYLYFFAPFVTYFLPNTTLMNMIKVLLTVFLIFMFFNELGNSAWTYADPWSLLIKPALLYNGGI